MFPVLLCVAGVCVLTYGDMRYSHSDTGGSTSDNSATSDSGSGNVSGNDGQGSMLGDVLLIIPNAFNALYAVEWKRLVPGARAQDSLAGLGEHCLISPCVLGLTWTRFDHAYLLTSVCCAATK